MAATIKQIADRAGVSPATVSLVLNMRPGIKAETRDKVFEAAADLEYRLRHPASGAGNATVRFLRIRKHGHIVNPNHRVFIADYMDGMEREASLQFCALETRSYEKFDPAEILASLEEGSVAGAIVLGTELDEADIEALRSSPVPLVFIDTFHSRLGMDFVDMDNESSVFAVVEYFKESGHRRIGIVTGSVPTRNFRLRERSFFESMERLGLPFDSDQDLFAIDSTDKGKLDMERILLVRRDLPTALFCVNDIVAYGCASALQEAGFSIPKDVSIIGFDDLPSNAYMSPPLCSVKVSKRRIGQCAMQLLALRLADPGKESEKILVGGELVIRGSASPQEAKKGGSAI